jgi:S1-C subfamily serine protease
VGGRLAGVGRRSHCAAQHGSRRAVSYSALALAGALLLGGCAIPRPASDGAGAPASFASALSRGMPMAVGVYGVADWDGSRLERLSRNGAPRKRRAVGADAEEAIDTNLHARIGAGFLVDELGHIVTSAHVIADCERIVIKLADQRVMLAEVIGEDADADIALLKIQASLPAPPVFGRTASLRTGDWVLAVGEPYGLNRSVAAGIVAGKDRHFAEDREMLFIQSDLALNPGNSGGPLLDISGAIVGMNSRVVTGAYGTSGVSLTIPIETVLQVVAELREAGVVVRPRLGAQFDDVPPPVALAAGRRYSHGALIGSVDSDSLAGRMGLQRGDIVVSMNGRPVADSADLTRALMAWRTTERTRLVVFRGGRYRELTLD